MQNLSPQQLAAMKQAMASRQAAGAPTKLTVGEALSAAGQLSKRWGSTALYYGMVPLLCYTGMRACDVSVGDIVASVCSLPLL